MQNKIKMTVYKNLYIVCCFVIFISLNIEHYILEYEMDLVIFRDFNTSPFCYSISYPLILNL